MSDLSGRTGRLSRPTVCLATLAIALIGLPSLAVGTASAAEPTAAAAVTAPAAVPAPSPWSANATSALAHVQVLNVVPGADVTLGPAAATADSSKAAGAATARGANLDALALGVLSLNNVLTDISQSSTPGSNAAPATGELLAVPASPVANADAGTAAAQAADISNGACPAAGGPVSNGTATVAGAQVLPALAGVGDAVDVSQTVTSGGGITLPSVTGQAGRGVTSTATSNLTQLSLLGGTVTIGIVHAPVLTATATGTPGGAAVTYTAPIVTVTIAGQTQTLSAPGQDLPIPGLGDLSLGVVTKTVAADGTSATGSASLLHLDISPAGVQVATVDLAPETATATAPSGGVLCAAADGNAGVVPAAPAAAPANPFSEFHKDLSALTVRAGQTFDSPLVISNRSTCTVTDATVTDVVHGTLSLVGAVPSPASSSGGRYSYGPFTLAPGQVVTIAQTFKAPAAAKPGTTYGDTATVTGTCAGVAETGTSTVSGPTVDTAGTGACDLRRSTLTSDHKEVAAGEEFDDLVNLFNAGGATCSDVTTVFTLPTGTTFVSCTDGCTHTGNTVTWAGGTLAPGASRTLAVTLLAPSTVTGATLTGGATITSGKERVALTTGLPRLTGNSVLAPGLPASRAADAPRVVSTRKTTQAPAQPVRTLAFTGAPPVALPALLLLGVAFGAGLLARRKRLG